MDKEQESRLRRQIEELVRSRLSGLEQDISRLQREVNESFTRLLERTDAAASVPESNEAMAQIAAEVAAQIGQSRAESARRGADIALLRDSVSELEGQSTQAEVLNTLVARAESFAPRAVLFVVKGDNALAWAARGFETEASNNAIRGLSVSLNADTALNAAFNSRQTFYGPTHQQTENTMILDRLGHLQPDRALAVPLQVRGKTAAIFYADSGDRGEDAINVEAIELLVYTTGLVVELVSLRGRVTAGAQPSRQAKAAAGGSQAPSPESNAEPRAAEVREPSGPLSTPSGALGQPQPGAPAYFKPAAEPPQPPAPEPPAAEFQSGALPEVPPSTPPQRIAGPQSSSLSEEEEEQHNAARRFARLLVSEIKLYNEQKVSEGRRNNDLYDRLKEDIDRSRQMYDKRVTPTVAAKFDYFYDELVNTLADGDLASLGSNAPGPSVGV